MSGETRALPREMVLASAGSGKTYRLSSRLIGLLAEGVGPEAIWASTFTRKAAYEILERVLLRLAEGALEDEAAEKLAEAVRLRPGEPAPGEALNRERAGKILFDLVHCLHRANIGTLDSFFVQVATTFARELGLAPTWRMVEGLQEELLRSEALEAVLDRKDPVVLAELVRFLGKGEVRRGIYGHLLEQVQQLLDVDREIDDKDRAAWIPLFEGVDPARGPSEDELESTCSRLADAMSAVACPLTKAGKPDGNWSKELDRMAQAVRARDWKEFLRVGLGKKLVDSVEVAAPAEVVFRGHSPGPELSALLNEVLALARLDLARDLTRQAAALARMAAWYRQAFEEAQETQGGYRFGDVTHLLRRSAALGQADSLYFRMDARVQHILLDEFQDTSLAQWEVLQPLVEELLAGGETERAAVVVADPKQSIYGWRGAQPSLVDRVRRDHHLKRDQLPKSFRSGPVILKAVEETFKDLDSNPVMDEAEGEVHVAEAWLRDFYPQVSNDPDQPGYVELVAGPRAPGKGGVQADLLTFAAGLIGKLHREEPRASMGVLVRTNKVVSYLIAALRRLGIPASGEGGTPLTDAAPVNALLALLRMADHPGNSLARYHVAMTPVGEMVGYSDHTDESQARRLARRIRARLLEEGYGVVLDEWARRLDPSCNRLESARLQQLVELGFRWDGERTPRPGDFVRLVEGQRVEDPSGAQIRVMTVHQSKGLQFDIVVLPHLYPSWSQGRNRDPVTPLRDEDSQRILRVFPAVDQGTRALFPELRKAHRQVRGFRIRDELSGLYVAMTRARYALHMVVPGDGEKGPGSAKNAAQLLRAALAPGVPADSEGRVLRREGDPGWFAGLKGKHFSGIPSAGDLSVHRPRAPEPVTLKTGAGHRKRNLARKSPSAMEGGGTLDPAFHLQLDISGDARRRGTVVHAWCEALEWIDPAAPHLGLPEEATLASMARREAPGLQENLIRGWISDFQAWMKSPLIQRILDRRTYPPGSTVERELPFLHRDSGEILQGYIDRLVLEKEEGRVTGAEVLDFKTDVLDASDPVAVAEKVAFYRPQIDAYREAVARRYGLDPSRVTGKLLFLRPGLVEDV